MGKHEDILEATKRIVADQHARAEHRQKDSEQTLAQIAAGAQRIESSNKALRGHVTSALVPFSWFTGTGGGFV